MLSLAAHAARKITHRKLKGAAQIRAKRKSVSEVIALRRCDRVRAERVSDNAFASQTKLRLDAHWTVPVTTIKGSGKRTLVLAEKGRAAAVGRARQIEGTVLAADVFGTGESWVPTHYQMTLSVTGERPLGILVGQILDVAKWAARSGTVHLDATGPVVSFAALCAAALRPKLFASLYVDGLLDSLKRLIDLPVAYNDHVPLFTFGLLKVTDVPQLIKMTEGLPIEWKNRGPVYSAGEVR